MTLPVTIPNQFANATSSIPLSQLDSNFNTLSNVINQINAGTQQLANANVAVLIVDAGTSAAPTITTTGDTNTGIFFPAADTIAFAEGGAEAMRITSGAALTIGSTTAINDAVGSLQLSGTGAGSTSGAGILSFFRPETDGVNNGDNLGSILFFGADTTGNTPTQLANIRAQATGTHTAGDNPTGILFSTTAAGSSTVTERMRIASSGNVGIGTTSPSEILTVTKDQNAATVFLVSNPNVGSSASAYAQFTSDSANAALGATSAATTSTSLGGRGSTFFINTGSGDSAGGIALLARNSAGYITMHTGGTTERMRITSGGELLIGTNTAASTQGGNLQVITSQAIRRNVASSAGGALRLEKSRSATDGGYTIVQDGDSLGDIQWFGSDGVDFAHAATVRGIVNGTPGSNDMPGALAFLTSADGSQTPTERMRIDSSGNVGIGTSAPSQQLHIANADDAIVLIESTGSDATDDANIQLKTTNGTFTIQNDRSIGTSGALTFAGNTSDNIVIDHNSGNVGIGTSSPATKLDVNGQISGKFTDVGTNTAAQALATNHVSQVTISANTTLTTTVPPAGAQAIVIIVSSGVTSRTVTFGAGFASTGTLATGTTADRRFVVSFVSDGTRLIECSRTAAITV